MATAATEMSAGVSAKLWEDEITPRLIDLIHSRNSWENLGGVSAIGARATFAGKMLFSLPLDSLLEISGDETIESRRNLFRFYHYVKHLLPHRDVETMLQASRTLGNITRIGGNAFGEQFLDKELPAAIVLLAGDKQEASRYAGVLILKELAHNSPIHFHAHIRLVFDKILIPLRDQRAFVREKAAELLAACFEILNKRERGDKNPYLAKMFQDAHFGLKLAQSHIVHGSLLTYRELLLHGGTVSKTTRIVSSCND